MTSINPGDVGVATSTAAAATINHTEGQVTTEALVTAAGANYVFTLTNNCVYPTSLMFVSVQVGGTNTRLPISVLSTVLTAGQAVITFQNNNAAALNGTVIWNFLVL
jgi:hypothetical protein